MSDPYNNFASLEWRLGCVMAEWQAARQLAHRLEKTAEEVDALNAAHQAGVVRLLQEYLSL